MHPSLYPTRPIAPTAPAAPAEPPVASLDDAALVALVADKPEPIGALYACLDGFNVWGHNRSVALERAEREHARHAAAVREARRRGLIP